MGLVLMADETSGAPAVVSDLADQRIPADRSDAELVTSLATGDRGAFAGLYDRYGKRAYSLARRLCVSTEFAEDVVQESFLVLWRAPERYDPARGAFSTWLLTLVHHRAVDIIRRESTQRKRVDALSDPALGAGSETASSADVDALAQVENDFKSRTFTALRKLRIALSPLRNGVAT